MTTAAINQRPSQRPNQRRSHRPVPYLAAAAAVVAIAAGTVTLSVSHHAGAPAQQPPITVGHHPQDHQFKPMDGGRVLVGE